jgi:methanogenic corrinoid protein MtbC1
MIRWCSYCQRFLGEKAPFDDYRLSHGICGACFDAHVFDEAETAGAERIRLIHEALRRAVAARDLERLARHIDGAVALNLRPIDLALGILQPLLYEIGDLWHREQLTVAHEHAMTETISRAFELTYGRFPELALARAVAQPAVLLCTAPTNTHTLGVDFAEMFLATTGVTVLKTRSGSVAEIVSKVAESRPAWVGISIAMPDQLHDAERVHAGIHALGLPEPPRVVVGGGACRGGGLGAPRGLTCVADLNEFAALLRDKPRPSPAPRVVLRTPREG